MILRKESNCRHEIGRNHVENRKNVVFMKLEEIMWKTEKVVSGN